jgi:hypothetical protein
MCTLEASVHRGTSSKLFFLHIRSMLVFLIVIFYGCLKKNIKL